MKTKTWLYIIIGIFVIALLSVILGYNSLVDSEEEVNRTQSQVVTNLNQRQEQITMLIPAIVGLQEHEKEIYDMITDAREAYARASDAGDIEGMIEADALEALAINNFLVVIEDNPDIKTSSAYQNFMDNVSALESKLTKSRQDYNNSVSSYNRSVKKFPKVLYAKFFGFASEKPYWKMNEGANEIPPIDFTNK